MVRKVSAVVCILVTVFMSSCRSVPTSNSLDLSNKRILVLGDSITHSGGYVSFIEYYLNTLYPKQTFDIISVGLSSETASGLSEKVHPFPRPYVHERLERALDTVKPDLVIACYGMNDGIYHPLNSERMAAYQSGINQLVAKAKAAGVKQVILQTPPTFDPQPIAKKLNKGDKPYSYRAPYGKYNETLKEFGRWIMTLESEDIFTVDLNTALSSYLDERRAKDPLFTFSTDGIHPDPMGHLLMAHTFMNAVGIDVKSKSLDAEYAMIKADKMYQLINKKRKMRSDAWLKYIGYIRRNTVKADSLGDVEEKVTALQKEIDQLKKCNRL